MQKEYSGFSTVGGLRTENMRILPSLDHTIANNHTPIHLRDILPQNIVVDSPISIHQNFKKYFVRKQIALHSWVTALISELDNCFGKLFNGMIWFLFTRPKVMKATNLWSGKACAFITLHGTEEYVLVTYCMVWFALL